MVDAILKLILIASSFFNLNINTNVLTDYIRFKRIENLYGSTIPMKIEHIVYVIDVAYMYEIDPDLVLAIIGVESNYNPNAANKTSSAKGYGQIIRSTANAIANDIDWIEDYNHSRDAFDPYINIHMTTYYLSRCISRSKTLETAIRYYRGLHDEDYFKKVIRIRNKIKENKKIASK